jgi:hypothetical protein
MRQVWRGGELLADFEADKRTETDGGRADLGGFDNPSGAPANELRGLVGGAKSVKTDWGGKACE